MQTYRTDALLADQLPKLQAGERFRLVIHGAGFAVLVVSVTNGKILRTVLQGEVADVTTAEIRAFKSQGGEVL